MNCGSPRASGLTGCPSESRPGHTPLLQHVHQGLGLMQGLDREESDAESASHSMVWAA